jgi:hypothetical protein
LEASTLEIKDFLFGEVGPDLYWPDTWDVRSRLYPLSLCAFDAAFYVIVAEEEFHYLWLFLVSVLHNASVCGGCRGFAALNNLGLALLLGDSLLGEACLRQSLGQPCDVPHRLLTSSFLYSSYMTWSPYVARSALVVGGLFFLQLGRDLFHHDG